MGENVRNALMMRQSWLLLLFCGVTLTGWQAAAAPAEKIIYSFGAASETVCMPIGGLTFGESGTLFGTGA